MIKEERRRSIKRAITRVKTAETNLDNARNGLRDELADAHNDDKSSFQELGELVGLSRQRVHQMLQ